MTGLGKTDDCNQVLVMWLSDRSRLHGDSMSERATIGGSFFVVHNRGNAEVHFTSCLWRFSNTRRMPERLLMVENNDRWVVKGKRDQRTLVLCTTESCTIGLIWYSRSESIIKARAQFPMHCDASGDRYKCSEST
jgi:hypothetical protein